ncbi:MAG: PfkB family carbohydrate kinase, partial [Cyanobacteriota bacterium]|nr:PfkB family carbohydrate kinase [Cyanobacteriota bacterium]
MSILVFGSLNMDLVVQTPQLPNAGETCIGRNFFTTPGGKGANQAVAAARLGVETQMVGCVGGDRFGEELRSGLRESGARVENVRVETDVASGIAVVIVGDRGENQILVVPGANDRVGLPDVERALPLLAEATLVLLQLEVPLPAIQATA